MFVSLHLSLSTRYWPENHTQTMCRLAEIAKEQRRLEEFRREEEEKKRLEEERAEREIERAAELKKEEAASAAAAARAGECSAPAAHLRIDCLKCVRMCVRACARARAEGRNWECTCGCEHVRSSGLCVGCSDHPK